MTVMIAITVMITWGLTRTYAHMMKRENAIIILYNGQEWITLAEMCIGQHFGQKIILKFE
jgi:hypothetical protein